MICLFCISFGVCIVYRFFVAKTDYGADTVAGVALGEGKNFFVGAVGGVGRAAFLNKLAVVLAISKKQDIFVRKTVQPCQMFYCTVF